MQRKTILIVVLLAVVFLSLVWLITFKRITYFDKALSAYREGNYKLAIMFYKNACEAGDVWGCYYAGNMYEEGVGVKHDYSLAYKFYEDACNKGSSAACYRLRKLAH